MKKEYSDINANKINLEPRLLLCLNCFRGGGSCPGTYDLCGLWDLLSVEQKDLFKTLIPMQIEARYPEFKEQIAASLTLDLCKKILSERFPEM